MILWPWDDFVRPLRTYFARKSRTRWKQRRNKGICSSCKLPFDDGRKRCVVDSCGHHRCYACLYAQDTCPVCSGGSVGPNPQDKLKFIKDKENTENQELNKCPNRKRLKIGAMRNNGIEYRERNIKRFSQISNISSEFSFEAALLNETVNDVTLKPLYFEVPQSAEDCYFLYRDWIFQEIYEEIMTTNLIGVVLEGCEGSGKTSLILQLVEWSTFGCKRKSAILNDNPSISWDTLMKLSSLVVGYHFCHIDCRETCLIPDFIHSLAAQLCQAPQLQKYRQLIVDKESYQELLSLESCIENPDQAFLKGVLEPLASLEYESVFPSILLIDSIHESEEFSRSISSFLATYINQFPSWLKVVITVNSENVDWICALPLHRINLNCGESKVKKDLLRYVHCRVKRSPLIATNVFAYGNENQFSRFAEFIISSENSSFLFVKLILDLIAQNHLVVKSTTFNVIPVSLDEIFMLIFNLRFPSMATFSKVRPILEVCLAAMSPLTAVDIFYSLESASIQPVISWSSFTEILNSLSSILIQRRDQSLMLSNASLRRWLVKNNKFVCDIRSGRTYLALLPTRIRYPLSPEKELELIYHISRCNLFENEESLKFIWIQFSWIELSAVLINPRVMFSSDEQIIRFLLKNGANSNSILPTHHKYPVLNFICKIGVVEIVSTFLNFGADPNSSNVFGITALMEAAIHGHLKTVEVLLSAGAKIYSRDKAGRCTLSWAAEKGNLKVVDILLQKKNSWPSLISFSQAKQRALIAAAGANNFDVCKYLIKADASEKITIEKISDDCFSQTLTCQLLLKKYITSEHLHQSAASGHLESLLVLFNKGVALDVKDVHGYTALSWCCMSGNTDVLGFLLEKGADITTKDNESSNLLHIAAMHGNKDVVKRLLELEIDKEAKNIENKTPLECAIATKHSSTVLVLLEAGVNIGSRAFELAYGNTKLYSILLNKLLSDGISLYKKGEIIEANRRFEYAWSKTNTELNFEQIRARLQECLHLCKCKMKDKFLLDKLPSS